MDGRFSEGLSEPIVISTSTAAIQSVLSYLYRGVIDIDLKDVCDILHLAHMHELSSLEQQVAEGVSSCWDTGTALKILLQCDALGIDALEEKCELHIASHFEEAALCTEFHSLSPAQLNRLLKNLGLVVRCEENALLALLAWQQTRPGRESNLAVLMQQLHFPCMALQSLDTLEQHAQTIGNPGTDLQREVRRAKRFHEATGGDISCPIVKRPCFTHWWSGLGSTTAGGVPIQLNNQSHDIGHIAIFRDSLFVSEFGHEQITLSAVREYKLNDLGGESVIVAGSNVLAPFSNTEILFCVDPIGRLLLIQADSNRVLRLEEDELRIVGDGQWQLDNPLEAFATADAVYVLDGPAASRIQKLLYGVATIVAGGNGHGSELNQFFAVGFFVTEYGVVFIADTLNDRVLRWAPGASSGTVVAGGNGTGSSNNQLNLTDLTGAGIYVMTNEDIFICDGLNHRVLKWRVGATHGIVVAGGHGPGEGLHNLNSPFCIAFDSSGSFYVLDFMGTEEFDDVRCTRWGPPPRLIKQISESLTHVRA